MPAGPAQSAVPTALPGVVSGEHGDHGDRTVERADQPARLCALQDARGGVAEGRPALRGGPVDPEDEVAEVGCLAGVVGPVEEALPAADEDRVGPADVEPAGRVGRRGVAGDAQRQRREDGEDALQGERNPGADRQGEDDPARGGGAVGGQTGGRLGLQPGVLTKVLRRQLEDQRRRVGVGNQLRSVDAGLHVTARGAQLRNDEVVGPEQADVDGISGVWGVPAKYRSGAENFVRLLRRHAGVPLLAVTRRRHGNPPRRNSRTLRG